MSEIRVIKKYPNRRLYDTVESRYITLDDVRRLVLDGVDFNVIDKRSQQDITRPVLLQVIAELEQRNGTVLSQDFLAQLIRSHDAGLEGVLSTYLEQSLRLFLSREAAGRRSGRRCHAAGSAEPSALAQRAGRNLPHADQECRVSKRLT